MNARTENIAPDVSALFRRLGAADAAASYKEFDSKSEAERAMARWPLLGRLARMKTAPPQVAAVTAPAQPAPFPTGPVPRSAIVPAAVDTPLKALFRQIGDLPAAAQVASANTSSKDMRTPLEDFLQRMEKP